MTGAGGTTKTKPHLHTIPHRGHTMTAVLTRAAKTKAKQSKDTARQPKQDRAHREQEAATQRGAQRRTPRGRNPRATGNPARRSAQREQHAAPDPAAGTGVDAAARPRLDSCTGPSLVGAHATYGASSGAAVEDHTYAAVPPKCHAGGIAQPDYLVPVVQNPAFGLVHAAEAARTGQRKGNAKMADRTMETGDVGAVSLANGWKNASTSKA